MGEYPDRWQVFVQEDDYGMAEVTLFRLDDQGQAQLVDARSFRQPMSSVELARWLARRINAWTYGGLGAAPAPARSHRPTRRHRRAVES